MALLRPHAPLCYHAPHAVFFTGPPRVSAFAALDFSAIRTYGILERRHKVKIEDVPPFDPAGLSSFSEASDEIRELGKAIRTARRLGKPIVLMMGAHAIKVGLSRYLRALIEKGFITHLAGNGAVPIHDFELSTFGRTSEEVEDTLPDGMFGSVRETLQEINEAAKEGARRGEGLGESLARHLAGRRPPPGHPTVSLMLAARTRGIPFTVHAAIGTDTIYQSPLCDGAAIGQTSYLDFRILAQTLTRIGDGGVVVNLGSSVVLPEVFVKALSVARNLTGPIRGFTAAVLDMLDHYRPRVNVLQRPTRDAGRSLYVKGRFEDTVPLLVREVFRED
ncbi:MAG: hypothetical protein HYY13_12310 [Nitrospirae bacterium]|nr:hypothetical protein [Nitrospirota bacterium]